MSAGSVSTPRSSDPPPTAPPRLRGEDDPSPVDNAIETGRRGLARVRSQLPSIPNGGALVQALTGRDDLAPMDAAAVLHAAQHGDAELSSSRSTRALRRDGGHVGARDAQVAASRQEVPGRDRGEPDPQLRAGVGLNAIAETMHVLGADAEVVDAIEDPQRVRVVSDQLLAGTAAYDSSTGQVLVSRSTVDQAFGAARMLQVQGVLDADGRIVAGREDGLDRSGYGDELVKLGTLIGVHELMHAAQDEHGVLDRAGAQLRDQVHASHREFSRDVPIDALGSAEEAEATYRRSDEAWEVERGRVAREEYDAYLAQEQADLQLGASLRVQLVTDRDGSPLPREHAVDNIVALERGRPLPHGPDAGWVRHDRLASMMRDVGIDPESVPWLSTDGMHAGATMAGEVPGWKRPGWKRPGWKRPGFATE